MPSFKELGVSEVLNTLLQGQGIVKPTPVQEEAIPPLVQGLDVIARAKTGTGKTLAFLLPIMDKIQVERAFPQALILAPTRELALQITEEARKLARHTGVKILAVYGGQDVEKQLRKLEGGRHLIIGTPGRLLDHMRRGTLDLNGVKMLVLDEADQMLHMGFLEDVETIITAVPYRRQTMLFSATMPDPVKRLAANYMKEPLDIVIKSGSPIPLDNIRQQVVECSDRNKEEALKQLIERDRPYLAIIFCRTKRRVSKLNEAMQAAGYDCDELHGDLSQGKREAVMKRFRDAKLQLLVATDVAARGLDVEGITHIFNYDMPLDGDSYIHRIGRTGRAGGKGLAITFASPRESQGLEMIEHAISQRLDRRRYEKDEFGIGEFTAIQTGGRQLGKRQGGTPEAARTGHGPKTGGRGQGRSGGAPRAEGSSRRESGGRGRGREADAGRGSARSGYSAGPSKGRSEESAPAKTRVGGGYGTFARGENQPPASSSAGARGGSPRGDFRGASKGNPSSGYSTNVARGGESGYSVGASKGSGSGSGYNPGGSKGSPKYRANLPRGEADGYSAGASKGGSPRSGGYSTGRSNSGGSASGGSRGGQGGFGSGSRSGGFGSGSRSGGSGGGAPSRGGRGNGPGRTGGRGK